MRKRILAIASLIGAMVFTTGAIMVQAGYTGSWPPISTGIPDDICGSDRNHPHRMAIQAYDHAFDANLYDKECGYTEDPDSYEGAPSNDQKVRDQHVGNTNGAGTIEGLNDKTSMVKVWLMEWEDMSDPGGVDDGECLIFFQHDQFSGWKIGYWVEPKLDQSFATAYIGKIDFWGMPWNNQISSVTNQPDQTRWECLNNNVWDGANKSCTVNADRVLSDGENQTIDGNGFGTGGCWSWPAPPHP